MGAALSLLADAAVAAGLFAATNVDDLVVLVALEGDRATSSRAIVAGQFVGIGVLTALSIGLARLALALPDGAVAALGVVPIALGIRMWWRRRTSRADDDAPVRTGLSAIAVTALTVANGADNVAAYTPAFTTRSPAGLLVTVVVFGIGTAAWLVVARGIVRHRRVGERIARWGERLLPLVLVAVGVLVLVHHG
ncbi:MAG: cadmium resistance transporter [Acidimicrobiales bacterium]